MANRKQNPHRKAGTGGIQKGEEVRAVLEIHAALEVRAALLAVLRSSLRIDIPGMISHTRYAYKVGKQFSQRFSMSAESTEKIIVDWSH